MNQQQINRPQQQNVQEINRALREENVIGTQARYRTEQTLLKNIIKKNHYSLIKNTGKIDLNNIKKVSNKAQEVLNTIGIWTPEDAYELYKMGKFEELKALTKYKDKNHNSIISIDTLANIIYASKNIPPNLEKQEIFNFLQSARDIETFESQRRKEIKRYLRLFNLGNQNYAIPITITSKGAGVTKKFIEQLYFNTNILPQHAVYGRRRIIMNEDEEIKERIKEHLYKYGMLPNNYKNKQKFFDPNHAEFTNRIKFLNELLSNKTIIKDNDWDGHRLNDKSTMNKIFESTSLFIGQTANPKLIDYAVIDTNSYGYKNKLVFQSEESDNRSIRIKGNMIIKNNMNLEQLISILGTNPKNGFAPREYDYTDDNVAESDVLSVYVKLPESQVNNVFSPNSIIPKTNEQGDIIEYLIKAPKKQYDTFLRSHLLIADLEKMKNDKKRGYKNILKDYEAKKFGQILAHMKKKEKSENHKLIKDLHFKEIKTYGTTYAGTMCYKYKKDLDKEQRDRIAFIKDIDEFLRLKEKYTNKVNTNDPQLSVILTGLSLYLNDPITFNYVSLSNNDKIYNMSIPACQIIDIENANEDKILIIKKDTPVFKKLNKIYNYCKEYQNKNKKTNIEKCMASLTKLVQNYSDKYFGGDPAYSPLDYALKNILNTQPNTELHNKASEIVREMRTGQKAINDNNQHLYESEKRKIMNEAKLRNKIPLTVNSFEFLHHIPENKNFKSYVLETIQD